MKLGPNETIELYRKVIVNAPYGRFAPLSQFAIAEIHQDQGEKNEAVAAYQTVVDNYPSSKKQPRRSSASVRLATSLPEDR